MFDVDDHSHRLSPRLFYSTRDLRTTGYKGTRYERQGHSFNCSSLAPPTPPSSSTFSSSCAIFHHGNMITSNLSACTVTGLRRKVKAKTMAFAYASSSKTCRSVCSILYRVIDGDDKNKRALFQFTNDPRQHASGAGVPSHVGVRSATSRY